MSQVTSELKKIYEEDVSANGSVSEAFFLKIASSMNWLIENAGDYVGKVEMTPLSEAQFAALKGYSTSVSEYLKKWVLIRGQSISGSKYHSLYGVSSLPNMVDNGAHPEQAKAGAATLAYFASQNKSHSHNLKTLGEGNLQYLYYVGLAYYCVGDGSWDRHARTGVASDMVWESGADVARPNSITLNFFLKIND